MESHTDRPQMNPSESLDTSSTSQVNDRPDVQTTQRVQGDRNQVIGAVSGGTVIANVETLNQYIQAEKPRFLSEHQLPPDITDFTGRTQELNAILAELRQDGLQNIIAISGMAGAGKSALVIRVAYELQSQFDQVQLYVNLRGADDHQALDPATVLVDWLRALGLDDSSIPVDLEARVHAYRSLLQGKRAIVLLDNAQNEDQVRPLLPASPTCAVLITSRKTLVTLLGTTCVNLPILPEEEALALLKQLIGTARVDAEPDPAAAILSLCGRLPLAIRIAAGTLKQPSQQRKSLADYANKLRNEQQRLTQLHLDHLAENLDVRTSFNLSYRELRAEVACLFRWLGLLVAPNFGVAVAAVLIETDEETAQQRLEHLMDAQLLEGLDANRYRFHDLIRLFAQEQLKQLEPTDQQSAAQQRVIQHFLDRTKFMNDCLYPERRCAIAASWNADNQSFSPEQLEQGLEEWAFAWFEQERLTLLTLPAWINQAQTWEQLTRLSSDLARFLDRRSYWLDAEQLHLQALHASQQLGDRYGEGQTLNNLGLVYQSQSKWEEAIERYQQSLEIKRQLGGLYGEGNTLNNLGMVYQSQSKWDKAIALYQQSLDVKRQLGDLYGEGNTLNNLGTIYDSQGKWEEAINLYQQSLNIYRQLSDRYGEGNVLNNLGNIYKSHGEREKAIDLYRESLEISRQLGDRYGEGQTLNNLGTIYDSQDQWEEAIDLYRQSLEIRKQLGDRYGEGQTLNNLGTLYSSQGKWKEAIGFYFQSLEIKRYLGDQHGEGSTLNNLGLTYYSQSKWKEAKQSWQEALSKLHPDSPEFQQTVARLQALDRSHHPTLLRRVITVLISLAAALFLLSNLLAGRWLVALFILLLSVIAFLILRATGRRR